MNEKQRLNSSEHRFSSPKRRMCGHRSSISFQTALPSFAIREFSSMEQRLKIFSLLRTESCWCRLNRLPREPKDLTLTHESFINKNIFEKTLKRLSKLPFSRDDGPRRRTEKEEEESEGSRSVRLQTRREAIEVCCSLVRQSDLSAI